MTPYDARGLRKPFHHPVIGRVLLLGVLLLFPVLGPAVAVWERRRDLLDEWREVARATFLPWRR